MIRINQSFWLLSCKEQSKGRIEPFFLCEEQSKGRVEPFILVYGQSKGRLHVQVQFKGSVEPLRQTTSPLNLGQLLGKGLVSRHYCVSILQSQLFSVAFPTSRPCLTSMECYKTLGSR